MDSVEQAGWEVYVPTRGLLIGQREKLGLSQEEVAKRAGIRLEQYQRYEKPNVDFTRTSSMRIVTTVCDVLKLNVSKLATGDYCLRPIEESDGITNEQLDEAFASPGKRRL